MTRRKRYSAEFKREAIRRANEEGVTDVLVAEELGVNARQLRRWREVIRQDGDKAFPGEGNAKDQELMLLKRKLAKVEQERDFLKEVAACNTSIVGHAYKQLYIADEGYWVIDRDRNLVDGRYISSQVLSEE
jgi:transposase